jgi:hypothetical protein
VKDALEVTLEGGRVKVFMQIGHYEKVRGHFKLERGHSQWKIGPVFMQIGHCVNM